MNMMLIKYLSFIVIFVLCLVQDRLNLSLVLLSLLLASQLVMKQSWAKRHSQGFIPTVSCFNSLPISSNGMALNKIIAAGRSVMSISSTENNFEQSCHSRTICNLK